MDHVIEHYDALGVTSESVRVVDHDVRFGISNDEGDGDEWPRILEKILAADIIVIGTPIWFGVRGSVAQLVIERLDGTYGDTNAVGQFPLYNKVGGVVVTGNEDGAHDAASTTALQPLAPGLHDPAERRHLLGGRRRPRPQLHRVRRMVERLHPQDLRLDGPQHGPHGPHSEGQRRSRPRGTRFPAGRRRPPHERRRAGLAPRPRAGRAARGPRDHGHRGPSQPGA